MNLSFCWYSPTHGDGRYIASPDNAYMVTPEYTVQNARLAEAAGFQSILVPAGPSCTDAFITATHIATATSTIRPLVAVRPGTFRPTSVAKMAATLDQICKGRLSLNIVTGGSPQELAMDGDFVTHDERYARTDEFCELLKLSWGKAPVAHFKGTYFSAQNAAFEPRPMQVQGPRLYLGGSSDQALATAAKHVDAYLMWGEPVEQVREQLRKLADAAIAQGRQTPSSGLRITLLVAQSDAAAWRRADELVSRISSTASDKVKKYVQNSDSIALSRIQSLAGKTTADPCFWTGMVPYRTGNSTVLVGSYDSVAKSIAQYARAGISEFIFSSYPHIETVSELGHELLPRVRALVDAPALS